jgi:hypothetical protein
MLSFLQKKAICRRENWLHGEKEENIFTSHVS